MFASAHQLIALSLPIKNKQSPGYGQRAGNCGHSKVGALLPRASSRHIINSGGHFFGFLLQFLMSIKVESFNFNEKHNFGP